MIRDLSKFSDSYDRGRGLAICALWFAVQHIVFKKWWFPAGLRPRILQLFGAKVGKKVLIRHDVRIMWPWKLEIGDDCWIGESAWIINVVEVSIGSNVCISQSAVICSGSHDLQTEELAYKNAPIRICDGAWVALRGTVLAGASLMENSVVAAGEVLAGRLEANHILVGGEVRRVNY